MGQGRVADGACKRRHSTQLCSCGDCTGSSNCTDTNNCCDDFEIHVLIYLDNVHGLYRETNMYRCRCLVLGWSSFLDLLRCTMIVFRSLSGLNNSELLRQYNVFAC